MAWHEPRSMEELNERTFASMADAVEGYGADVVTTIPCPWCGSPEFMRLRITHTDEDMATNTTCKRCGRSGMNLVEYQRGGGKTATFVQTGGPVAPEWMENPPLRVEASNWNVKP